MSKRDAVLSFFLISIAMLLPACSCNNAQSSGDKKIVAKINNYYLTVADFNNEIGDKIPSGLPAPELEKAKEVMLDGVILKKLLIQEAQKQNFDKDKAFTKEIERYWEQALLKLLYNKRSQELSREAGMAESDPEAREKKVREALNAWITGLKERADIKKYRENL